MRIYALRWIRRTQASRIDRITGITGITEPDARPAALALPGASELDEAT